MCSPSDAVSGVPGFGHQTGSCGDVASSLELAYGGHLRVQPVGLAGQGALPSLSLSGPVA